MNTRESSYVKSASLLSLTCLAPMPHRKAPPLAEYEDAIRALSTHERKAAIDTRWANQYRAALYNTVYAECARVARLPPADMHPEVICQHVQGAPTIH